MVGGYRLEARFIVKYLCSKSTLGMWKPVTISVLLVGSFLVDFSRSKKMVPGSGAHRVGQKPNLHLERLTTLVVYIESFNLSYHSNK